MERRMSLEQLLSSVSALTAQSGGGGLGTQDLVMLYDLQDETDLLWGIDWTSPRAALPPPSLTQQPLPPALVQTLSFTVRPQDVKEGARNLAHLGPLAERFPPIQPQPPTNPAPSTPPTTSTTAPPVKKSNSSRKRGDQIRARERKRGDQVRSRERQRNGDGGGPNGGKRKRSKKGGNNQGGKGNNRDTTSLKRPKGLL